MVGWLSRNSKTYSRLYLGYWLGGWVGTITTIQDYIWTDGCLVEWEQQQPFKIIFGMIVECWVYSYSVQCTCLQASGWLLSCLQNPTVCCVQCTCLQASGWLLICLQNPTAVYPVHVYRPLVGCWAVYRIPLLSTCMLYPVTPSQGLQTDSYMIFR